ncbi:MAG TPA: hypothetical protein VFX30_14990 [bacterium]|nr:hypothetical protein [bacterium]
MPTTVSLHLWQHVLLWSQFPTALITVNPIDAASLAARPAQAVEGLNRFVGEMRIQEINLLKALQINPDTLQAHLDREESFSDFFMNLRPRPAWMERHPNISLTIDDMHQFRRGVAGAKSRLNHWSRRLSRGRPAGLPEHLLWLQEFARSRAQLALLSLKMGESGATLERFYDPQARKRANVILMEESLKVYFQVQRPSRPGP